MKKIIINDSKELLKYKWKTKTCNAGAKCWCRMIVPISNFYYNKIDEANIIGAGELKKDLAEYLVKLHNSSLKKQ
jgi:hypothetical protein